MWIDVCETKNKDPYNYETQIHSFNSFNCLFLIVTMWNDGIIIVKGCFS
jgi:hypothetical protein